MIKVSFLYPNEEGKQFDMDYYTGTHMPLVHQRLDSCGLLRSEVESGVSSADPNAPAPFIAVGNLYFKHHRRGARGVQDPWPGTDGRHAQLHRHPPPNPNQRTGLTAYPRREEAMNAAFDSLSQRVG